MILAVILLLISSVSARLESWHYRAVRVKEVEACSGECDDDVRCRTWIYHMDSRECRLNEYIETAKNKHVAIDEGVEYVAGVKHGKKRLRHAAFHARLDSPPVDATGNVFPRADHFIRRRKVLMLRATAHHGKETLDNREYEKGTKERGENGRDSTTHAAAAAAAGADTTAAAAAAAAATDGNAHARGEAGGAGWGGAVVLGGLAFLANLSYGATSFGSAIVFQCGLHAVQVFTSTSASSCGSASSPPSSEVAGCDSSSSHGSGIVVEGTGHLAVFMFVTRLIQTAYLWPHVNFDLSALVAATSSPCLVLGALLAFNLPTDALQLILGLVLFSLVVINVVRSGREKMRGEKSTASPSSSSSSSLQPLPLLDLSALHRCLSVSSQSSNKNNGCPTEEHTEGSSSSRRSSSSRKGGYGELRDEDVDDGDDECRGNRDGECSDSFRGIPSSDVPQRPLDDEGDAGGGDAGDGDDDASASHQRTERRPMSPPPTSTTAAVRGTRDDECTKEVAKTRGDGGGVGSWRHVAMVAAAGGASGALTGLCGVPGPPMMLLLTFGVSVDSKEWRGSTALANTAVAVVQAAVFLGWHGDYSSDNTTAYACMVIGGVAGLCGGNLLAPLVDGPALQRCLLVFLATGSASMVTASLSPLVQLVSTLSSAAVAAIAVLALKPPPPPTPTPQKSVGDDGEDEERHGQRDERLRKHEDDGSLFFRANAFLRPLSSGPAYAAVIVGAAQPPQQKGPTTAVPHRKGEERHGSSTPNTAFGPKTLCEATTVIQVDDDLCGGRGGDDIDSTIDGEGNEKRRRMNASLLSPRCSPASALPSILYSKVTFQDLESSATDIGGKEEMVDPAAATHGVHAKPTPPAERSSSNSCISSECNFGRNDGNGNDDDAQNARMEAVKNVQLTKEKLRKARNGAE